MSNYDASYSSYYEQNNQCGIEKAILAEDVKFTTIDNVQGKFFLPVMTPTADVSAKAKVSTNGARTTANYVTLNIPGYMLFQFMVPSVSQIQTKKTKDQVIGTKNSYKLTLLFGKDSFTIPKGTVFLVEFIGGDFTIDKTCIVGLLTTSMTSDTTTTTA